MLLFRLFKNSTKLMSSGISQSMLKEKNQIQYKIILSLSTSLVYQNNLNLKPNKSVISLDCWYMVGIYAKRSSHGPHHPAY